MAATAYEETTRAGLTGARYPGGGALCGLSAWHLRDRLCLSQNRLPSSHISALAVNDIEGLDLALSRCSALRHTARTGSRCRRHAGEPRREGAESQFLRCAHPGATVSKLGSRRRRFPRPMRFPQDFPCFSEYVQPNPESDDQIEYAQPGCG